MIGAIVTLIIYLLILGCLYAVADYAIANLLPDPPARVLRVVLVVLIAIVAILLLLQLINAGTGLQLPKIVN
jgi:hypothetical protein